MNVFKNITITHKKGYGNSTALLKAVFATLDRPSAASAIQGGIKEEGMLASYIAGHLVNKDCISKFLPWKITYLFESTAYHHKG